MKNSIKKVLLAGAAMVAGMAASVSGGNVVDTQAPTQVAQQQDQSPAPVKDAVSPIQKANEAIRISLRHYGDAGYGSSNNGVPPRAWGEYLQRAGKQKWTKSKR